MLTLVLKNAFHPKGKSTRLGYFLYGTLLQILIILLIVLMVLPSVQSNAGIKFEGDDMKQALMGIIAVVPLAFANIWVLIIQTIKRLRDLGQSGWWLLLVIFLIPLPYIGILTSIGFYVYIQFFKGDSKENPKSAEWFWVLGLMIIAGAIIGYESQHHSALNASTQTEPQSAKISVSPSVSAPIETAEITTKDLDDTLIWQTLGKPTHTLDKMFAKHFPDLDNDGINDVFLANPATDCGNGGCSYVLVVSNNRVPKNVGTVGGTVTEIEGLPSSTSGLRDLKTTSTIGCQTIFVDYLKFDGASYKSTSTEEKPGRCAIESTTNGSPTESATTKTQFSKSPDELVK